MNISYVAAFSGNFPSRDANSIHVMRMCEAFTELGHKVTLYVSAKGVSSSDIFKHYGMAELFEIKPVKVLNIKGRSVLYAASVSRHVDKAQPDLVVSRATLASALIARRGIKVVYDSHGPLWRNGLFERLAFKRLAAAKGLVGMTTNSTALKDMYIDIGLVPPCGITVANNGSKVFPLDEYPAEWRGRSGCLQVGYTGHLYPGRGVEIIFDCAKALPHIDFHIIGGTDKDIAYWQQQATGNIYLHGFVTPTEVHKYRNKCDILLAPYQGKGVSVAGGKGDSSAYMNPLKLIEYLSSSKAIICSDIPVLKEVMLHGNNAYLCQPDNAAEWIKAIEHLTASPELALSIASNAYQTFLAEYTWQKRAEKMLEKASS